MKYFILAGEVSGDKHGAALVRALKEKDSNAIIHCWGGKEMAKEGAIIRKSIDELAIMGLIEVLRNIKSVLRNFSLCKKQIEDFHPDVVVFIDYPGLNFPILRWTKKRGHKTVYYIPPQLWAWKTGRIKTLRRYADEICLILPFEKEFYEKRHTNAHYVGHPLVEEIGDKSQLEEKKEIIANRSHILLAPGSRKQEVKKMLPTMLSAAKCFPKEVFKVIKSPIIESSFYQSLISPLPNVKLCTQDSLECMKGAKAAVVTSGTATLETALMGIPEMVVYRMHPLSFWVARMLVKIPFISLVNIIRQKHVVKEFIQYHFTSKKIAEELKKILNDTYYRSNMISEFHTLRSSLQMEKTTSHTVASIILKCLNK